MDPDLPLPNRLKAASRGLGSPSADEVEHRAIELAKIVGHDVFTDADLAQAEAELGGGSDESIAPGEEAAVAEDLQTWDAPVQEAGHRVESVPLEDEANVPEQLIAEGVDEADHDRRASATEERSKE